MNQLHTELQTYEQKKPELLANSRGKFVLVKGDNVIGVYENQNDAINEGFVHFKNSPFLVKQILDIDTTYNFLSQIV